MPQHLPIRLTAIWGPAQHKLLRAWLHIFLKNKVDPPKLLRPVEEEADHLGAGGRSAPARARPGPERRFDGVIWILRRQLYLRDLLQVEPVDGGSRTVSCMRANRPFAHDSLNLVAGRPADSIISSDANSKADGEALPARAPFLATQRLRQPLSCRPGSQATRGSRRA